MNGNREHGSPRSYLAARRTSLNETVVHEVHHHQLKPPWQRQTSTCLNMGVACRLKVASFEFAISVAKNSQVGLDLQYSLLVNFAFRDSLVAVGTKDNQIVERVLLNLGVVHDVVNLDRGLATVGHGASVTGLDHRISPHLRRYGRTVWHHQRCYAWAVRRIARTTGTMVLVTKRVENELGAPRPSKRQRRRGTSHGVGLRKLNGAPTTAFGISLLVLAGLVLIECAVVAVRTANPAAAFSAPPRPDARWVPHYDLTRLVAFFAPQLVAVAALIAVGIVALHLGRRSTPEERTWREALVTGAAAAVLLASLIAGVFLFGLLFGGGLIGPVIAVVGLLWSLGLALDCWIVIHRSLGRQRAAVLWLLAGVALLAGGAIAPAWANTAAQNELANSASWSADGFATFTVTNPGVPYGISNVACVTPTHCLAVGRPLSYFDGGREPVVEETTDRGGHWQAHGISADLWFPGGLACTTSRTCVAIGTPGGQFQTVLVARSFGGPWTVPRGDFGAAFEPSSVACAGNDCVISGTEFDGTRDRPVFFASRDGGKSWSRGAMPSLTAVRFDSLACTPALCVAAGNRWIKVTGSLGIRPGQGVLLLSRDHGISWHLAPLPRQVTGVEVEAIAATGGDGWVVGGASGLVAWTSNEGRSWTVSHPLLAMRAVMGLSCPGNGRCQAIGTTGTNVVAIASIRVLARTAPSSRNDFRTPTCKRPRPPA